MTDKSHSARDRDRLVASLRDQGYVRSASVERALRAVPRAVFVPDEVRDRAYEDEPLDIGDGQVVTAPHLVARMCELLELRPGHRVLEVGTGCGYHAAVVAELVGAENVVSIERISRLARVARENLAQTGYGAVTVIVADGSEGYAARAPYDRIYAACAAPDVPPPLVEQLADEGRLLVPVGGRRSQALVLVEKEHGRTSRITYDPVRFVPLVGEYGADDGTGE